MFTWYCLQPVPCFATTPENVVPIIAINILRRVRSENMAYTTSNTSAYSVLHVSVLKTYTKRKKSVIPIPRGTQFSK